MPPPPSAPLTLPPTHPPPLPTRPGASILSLDVSADGTKLATAGFDRRVRLWNTRPLLDPGREADASVPRLLATLGEHEQPVNIVRFAPSGTLIASGAGDAVIVHELRAGRGMAVRPPRLAAAAASFWPPPPPPPAAAPLCPTADAASALPLAAARCAH